MQGWITTAAVIALSTGAGLIPAVSSAHIRVPAGKYVSVVYCATRETRTATRRVGGGRIIAHVLREDIRGVCAAAGATGAGVQAWVSIRTCASDGLSACAREDALRGRAV